MRCCAVLFKPPILQVNSTVNLHLISKSFYDSTSSVEQALSSGIHLEGLYDRN